MAVPSNKRYLELIDDISNHVFQWATDDDWKKLPPRVNVALTTLMNELKIADSLKKAGMTDNGDDSIASEKRRFVALFRKKYLETMKFEYKDPVTPVNSVNIARIINDLKAEGGKYEEFLEWFFNDFCSLESNKKFMPPEINFMCSNHVLKKYLYVMKDTLRIRKENVSKERVRTMLLEIALPMQQRINQKDFAQKIIDFDNGLITATKLLDLMKAFAKKYNDEEGLKACNMIDEQLEQLKKKQ